MIWIHSLWIRFISRNLPLHLLVRSFEIFNTSAVKNRRYPRIHCRQPSTYHSDISQINQVPKKRNCNFVDVYGIAFTSSSNFSKTYSTWLIEMIPMSITSTIWGQIVFFFSRCLFQFDVFLLCEQKSRYWLTTFAFLVAFQQFFSRFFLFFNRLKWLTQRMRWVHTKFL